MKTLVLIEDDPTIRELVARRLQSKGYTVSTFDHAEPLMNPGDKPLGDLFIVDIMLKGSTSGLDLCRTLRGKFPTLPILILSALSEATDRIEGLKSGADDYLGKPFEMEELFLRIEGMLRRSSWYGNFPNNQSLFLFGDCEVNFQTLQARKGSTRFTLGQREGMLLKLLIEREGEVVTRDEILDQVWGYAVFPSVRTVDNFILRLRKLFEDNPGEPVHIQSVRGQGYLFHSGAGK
jgi:two-component system alkaline phosphatase synthesis response regulator PhoP